MSPQPDSVMMQHMMDSSSFEINRAYTKGAVPNSLDDSLTLLVNSAIAMIRNRIPYVWGGRHVDRATKWFSDADAGGGGYDLPGSDHDNNSDCPSRIGLDCSGFVQYMFEKVGFGRHSPDINVAALNDVHNWEFMENRGYHAKKLPAGSALQPGDVLFFQNAHGELSHIGIYGGPAQTSFGIGPAFIASVGYPDCDHNYQREASGHPTGVSASFLAGYWAGQLNSIIRFSAHDSAFGIIHMHLTMGGSQTQQEGDLTEEKTDNATIDYTIHLKLTGLQPYYNGGELGAWQSTLNGSCDWTQQTKDTYPCNGGSATDITNESWTLTGPAASDQIMALQFTIDSAGKYQFSIAPGIDPTAKITHYIMDKTTNCDSVTHSTNENDLGTIPFVQYLTPFTCGAMGSFQGDLNSDHLQGKWECTDQYTIFNTGTTPLYIPVNVQVSWSFTIQ